MTDVKGFAADVANLVRQYGNLMLKRETLSCLENSAPMIEALFQNAAHTARVVTDPNKTEAELDSEAREHFDWAMKNMSEFLHKARVAIIFLQPHLAPAAEETPGQSNPFVTLLEEWKVLYERVAQERDPLEARLLEEHKRRYARLNEAAQHSLKLLQKRDDQGRKAVFAVRRQDKQRDLLAGQTNQEKWELKLAARTTYDLLSMAMYPDTDPKIAADILGAFDKRQEAEKNAAWERYHQEHPFSAQQEDPTSAQ